MPERILSTMRQYSAIVPLIIAIIGLLGFIVWDSKSIETMVQKLSGVEAVKSELKHELKDEFSVELANFNHELIAVTGSLEQVTKRLTETVQAFDNRITLLESRLQETSSLLGEAEPALIFEDSGHKIDKIGSVLQFTWKYRKIHNRCGPPTPIVYIQDNDGFITAITDLSIVDTLGRGIVVPANPSITRTIKYTGNLPSNTAVRKGSALIWVVLSYEACPRMLPASSPKQPIILE